MLLPTTTLQGEKVTGPLTCYWGVRKHSTMSGDVDVAVGDISIGLEAKSGSGLTFTRRASLDAEGESVSIESIFGDRISSAAPRGFALVDGAYNQPIVNDWRLDPYPGFLPNGDPLTDLSAKSIVAASTGAKRTAELLPRDGQMVLPHEVLEWRDIFSHTRQTLTELVYLPFQGVYETTMQALSWDSAAFTGHAYDARRGRATAAPRRATLSFRRLSILAAAAPQRGISLPANRQGFSRQTVGRTALPRPPLLPRRTSPTVWAPALRSGTPPMTEA